MTKSPIADRQPPIANGLFVTILLVAAFLRLYRLDTIPPGMTHDEADTGYFIEAVYRTGAPSSVETPYGYAYQPFTMYVGVPFMALFGPNDLAVRMHTVSLGMALLVFTYLWTRRSFGTAVGLGSAALVAVSYWTVSMSRVALNISSAPPLVTGAVYFLWLAIDHAEGKRRWWAWGLFVLLLATSFYAYESALAASASFGLLLIYLAIFHRPRLRRHAIWFIGALLLVGLLTAPHLLDPSSWGRTNMLSGPIKEAAQGNLKPLLSNVASTLGTFSFSGDSFLTYNLPGRPIFDPVTSLFFCGGVVLCLWRWRKPACAFTLMWMAMGLVPSLITGEWTNSSHSNAAQSPILALPALCAVEVGRFISKRIGQGWSRVFATACVVWLIVIAAFTSYDYLIRWGQSPDTRAAYFQNMVAIADYLADTEYSGAVVLSAPFPDVPLDPFIVDMRMRRDDLRVRWFDGRRAVVFPDATHSLFILPPSTPLDPYFVERLDLQPIERVHQRPDDIDPYFDVFEWNPSKALSRFLEMPGRAAIVNGESFNLPIDFDTVELLAYAPPAPEVSHGETVSLATLWRVRDPNGLGPVPETAYGRAAALFVHVLDADGTIVGQEDRLDAPAWNWRAGDTFVQLHRVQIPADTPPGQYSVAVGIYNRHSRKRLPVVADGVKVSDRVFLEPVRVTGK
jgi:4-amino-4-deoxy-L-arabinose transferase-like glycosyltransferase